MKSRTGVAARSSHLSFHLISFLCLKAFLIGEVLLSMLDIQLVALDMMLLLTPPETDLKHGEAAGGGRKQGSHNPPSAHDSKRWKVLSLERGKQHHRTGFL